jgi:hypothetical protein
MPKKIPLTGLGKLSGDIGLMEDNDDRICRKYIWYDTRDNILIKSGYKSYFLKSNSTEVEVPSTTHADCFRTY